MFSSEKFNENAKIRVLSADAKEVIEMECDGMSRSIFQQLPIVVLSKIISNLNIIDQKHFSDTCKAAKMVKNQSINSDNFFLNVIYQIRILALF